MRIIDNRWFRRLLLTSIFTLGIVGILASGSSSDDDDGPVTLNFPDPMLPIGARTIDVGNADVTAQEAIVFASLLALIGDLADFKTAAPPAIEAPPAIAQVIQQAIDRFYRDNRNTPSVATGATEDLSAEICTSGGSAIADFFETPTSAEANIVFTACDTGFGVIGGNLSLDGTFDASGNYDIRTGGTLTISDPSIGTVTFVLDVNNSGNDFSGNFTSDITYSVEGAPGGGYLVTTTVPFEGIFPNITSGELIVEGSGLTRLRIRVINTNLADVYLDDGDGPFDILINNSLPINIF